MTCTTARSLPSSVLRGSETAKLKCLNRMLGDLSRVRDRRDDRMDGKDVYGIDPSDLRQRFDLILEPESLCAEHLRDRGP